MIEVNDFVKKYGVERKQTNSVKWDGMSENFAREDLLPLWVADMEFKAPEAVQKALLERVEHGVFGYTVVPDSYYETFFAWQAQRYQVTLQKEWLRFSPGVVSSFYWMVNAFTEVQESVLILAPVYYPFYDSIKETGRKVVTSQLVNEAGKFTIDFHDVEQQIIEHQVKLFIHCSPHNPVGRVWTLAEQEQLFEICLKHNVIIVSDEIHQDLTRPDITYVSSLNMAEKYRKQLIVLTAPSKTFNLAGLLNSHIIIPDKELGQRYDEYAVTVNKGVTSLMGIVAAEAAYQSGAQWLTGLVGVIEHNYQILKTAFAEKTPHVILSEKEGTYLAWVDLRAYLKPSETKEFMEDKCGLAIDYGEWFGQGYEGYIRINLGTDPKYIEYASQKITSELLKLA